MEIKVKCSCGEGNCPEWAILELQGIIEAQPSFRDRLQNLQIGVLCRHSSEVLIPVSILILFRVSPSGGRTDEENVSDEFFFFFVRRKITL